MRYRANRSNPQIGIAWTAPGFNDSGWASGHYGAGYELAPPGAEALIQTTVTAHSYSVYTRALFTIADLSQVQTLLLGVDYDDGYIAWINGVEVARSSEMPSGCLLYTSDAADE